ncbi:ABC transporter permease subunit [Bradyrhizobium sp. 187]|uniref:ABC transporter permease n=1 Tax=Bradyrhizobium sp. 187 TaxID=2782655 RepID=UPI001FFF8686|nr:ABC transporter permease subunit [Bradyrhizobium sp. 187]UPJ71863.1 ABC transporter permease subunit [Bradyrhizobium sp. 187]
MSNLARGLLVPAVLLGAAEGAAQLSGMRSDAVAPPSAVIAAFRDLFTDRTIVIATLDTLTTTFAGLGLGGGFGLVLGLVFGLVRPLDRVTSPAIEIVRPIPSIALIPIAIIAFGFGYSMEVYIVAFACLWPILILTRTAISEIDPRLIEVSRVLRLTLIQKVTKIVIPAVLPRIVVSIRLAAGVALVVAVTVEIAANPLGLGNAIMVAQQSLRPAVMLAYLVWIGIVGFMLSAGLTLVQRHLLGRAAVIEAER